MTGYKLFAMAQLVTITPLLVYEKKNYSHSKQRRTCKGDSCFILKDIKTEPGRVLNPKYIIVSPNWVHDWLLKNCKPCCSSPSLFALIFVKKEKKFSVFTNISAKSLIKYINT